MNSTELRAYLTRCDEALFKDPRHGFLLAQRGPQLARELENRDLEVQALAILAGAHRMVADYETAEKKYAEALNLAPQCPPLVQADLYRRLAVLRYSQGRLSDGIQLSTESEEIFQRFNRPKDQAWSQVTRGNILHQGSMHGHPEWLGPAIQDFSSALQLIEIHTAPRIALGALHGFIVAIAESPSPRLSDLENALRATSHFSLKPRTAPYAKTLWARGLIFRYIGCWNRAEKLMTRARDELAHLGLPMETALVSLDLGALLYLYPDTEPRGKPGRWERLGEIAAHAVMLFRDRLPAEMLAALALWRDAIAHQELSAELGRKIRQTIATGDPRFLRDDNGAALGPPVVDGGAWNAAPQQRLALPSARERQLTQQAFPRPNKAPKNPPHAWKGRRLNFPLAPPDSAALAEIAENLGVSHAEAMRVAIRTLATQHQAEAEEARRKRWEAPKKPKPWEGLE